MTERTHNSIESLTNIPFHLFTYQWKLLEEKMKRDRNKKPQHVLAIG